ncbi:glycosyltransferase family 4 protein [Azohydromonas lata]|uniref:Glycosyltransferase family 4 protein n=1 Tax=Azohydromonas lata TaxID=45677 RepID=A0ABU5IEQ2_9BURK|nr:glycosyltransferase family 4 protein [Azohydromonas lata]MDZ5457140.1 glycosyltransferase family 4 protein [Azohydromonas lata]
MRLLFIHQNFPGQFKLLSAALAARGDCEVVALGSAERVRGRTYARGVKVLGYPDRAPGPEDGRHTHHYLREHERAVRRGQDVARALLELHRKGFTPDVVVAHPGWGESLFVKDVFPRARLINLFEFFYAGNGADVGFDAEFPVNEDDRLRLRIKNNTQLQALAYCDQGLSPTQWQRSRFPERFHPLIEVLHEGLDLTHLRPNPDARFTLPNGRVLSRGDRVLTYVARNLEPYRGFHVFMRALPQLLAREPDLQVVVAGATGVSYGSAPPKPHATHLDWLVAEGGRPDPERVHFTGPLPYGEYVKLLQVSSVHCYLTYPFVLSWSMLEAMACGCAVLGSATPPVQEFIEDGVNGRLLDFFDQAALRDGVSRLLREDTRALRERARATVAERIDFHRHVLPRALQLLGLT